MVDFPAGGPPTLQPHTDDARACPEEPPPRNPDARPSHAATSTSLSSKYLLPTPAVNITTATPGHFHHQSAFLRFLSHPTPPSPHCETPLLRLPTTPSRRSPGFISIVSKDQRRPGSLIGRHIAAKYWPSDSFVLHLRGHLTPFASTGCRYAQHSRQLPQVWVAFGRHHCAGFVGVSNRYPRRATTKSRPSSCTSLDEPPHSLPYVSHGLPVQCTPRDPAAGQPRTALCKPPRAPLALLGIFPTLPTLM